MPFPTFHRIFSILLVFTAATFAYVGKWHSFTNKERVTSLIAHQGEVYAGTQGGIRRIDPGNFAEKDYDNLDGLLDCWITGLAETGDGNLWAVSKSGYVYMLSGGGWESAGRGYAASQWLMNDRAVLAVGHYLLLGSQLGLTFFDVNKKVAQANVTRFENLTGVSVLSLLLRADTLYVGTSQGVYKAGIDLKDPVDPDTAYDNLLDSHAWHSVNLSATDSTGLSPRQYNFMTFIGDSLKTFGPGMMLQSPIHVEVFQGQPALIGNHAFSAVSNQTAALLFNGKVFIGGNSGIFVSSNPTANLPILSALSRPSKFPRDTLANVTALQGKLWGQGGNGLYQLDPNTGDTLSLSQVTPYSIANPNPSLMDRHLRNLKAAPNGDVYVGSWGGGLIRYRNATTPFVWNKTTDSCMFEVVSNFPVVYGVSNVRMNDLFFTMFKSEGGADHQLMHLNTATGRIHCMDPSAPGGYPHAVRMFSDSLFGVGSDAGIALYKMREGPGGTPILNYRGLWTTAGAANETWSLTEDRQGRPWALVGNNLAYVEPDSVDSLYKINKPRLKTVDGFAGTDCFSLESDPVNSFWVGCGNGLFHIEPGPTGIAKQERFGLDDGLLSLSIRDIVVDPSNGKVWIATDRGISMLESSSQPQVTTLQTVQVYPNPFRPQHRFVIFDNLPKASTVRIHNAAGAVVRTFHPGNLTGNQAQWDGTNEDGRAVSAGVYLYSVTAGSSVERGKIIVAR